MELRNEILLRATELGKLLAQTEEVIDFKAAERAMWEHPQAKSRLDQIKQLEGSGDTNDQAELEALFNELEYIPEVNNFQKAQEQVQALLQTISEIVADSVLTS